MPAAEAASKPGHYWDLNECRWVRCPVPADAIPAQADSAAAEQIATAQGADVRSG
jgi:hypothetical protein